MFYQTFVMEQEKIIRGVRFNMRLHLHTDTKLTLPSPLTPFSNEYCRANILKNLKYAFCRIQKIGGWEVIDILSVFI